MQFSHDTLEVGEVCQEFPGSFFEHCELTFGCSLVVRVVVGAIEEVSEFFDGVEVDSVVDDVGVDHLVGSALEE